MGQRTVDLILANVCTYWSMNFSESTINYVYKKKENMEMIIKKEKGKTSVAMVKVRSYEVNPDIDPRKHPELLGTQMLRVITNVFQMFICCC